MGFFLRFLNCTDEIKSRKASHMQRNGKELLLKSYFFPLRFADLEDKTILKKDIYGNKFLGVYGSALSSSLNKHPAKQYFTCYYINTKPICKKIDSNSFAGKYLVKHNTEKVENNSGRCSIVMLSAAVHTFSSKYVFLKMFHNLQENTYV